MGWHKTCSQVEVKPKGARLPVAASWNVVAVCLGRMNSGEEATTASTEEKARIAVRIAREAIVSRLVRSVLCHCVLDSEEQ